MTLIQVISQLDHFEDDCTIFAALIDGEWTYDSPATVVQMSDEELKLPVSAIAMQHCPGMQYLLEVFIAKEVVHVWSLWRDQTRPTAQDATNAVIHYAKYDAYLPTDEM